MFTACGVIEHKLFAELIDDQGIFFCKRKSNNIKAIGSNC